MLNYVELSRSAGVAHNAAWHCQQCKWALRHLFDSNTQPSKWEACVLPIHQYFRFPAYLDLGVPYPSRLVVELCIVGEIKDGGLLAGWWFRIRQVGSVGPL